MKYGPAHGNYQHGGYSQAPETGDVKIALAKDLLKRVLTTPCDAGGRVPFTNDECAWAMRVVRERPEWARDVLKGMGFSESQECQACEMTPCECGGGPARSL